MHPLGGWLSCLKKYVSSCNLSDFRSKIEQDLHLSYVATAGLKDVFGLDVVPLGRSDRLIGSPFSSGLDVHDTVRDKMDNVAKVLVGELLVPALQAQLEKRAVDFRHTMLCDQARAMTRGSFAGLHSLLNHENLVVCRGLVSPSSELARDRQSNHTSSDDDGRFVVQVSFLQAASSVPWRRRKCILLHRVFRRRPSTRIPIVGRLQDLRVVRAAASHGRLLGFQHLMMDKFLSLGLMYVVLRPAILSLQCRLRGDSRPRSLGPGLEGVPVAEIGLAGEPAPTALVVLRLALEDRLTIEVEPLAFPAGRAHAFITVFTGDAPFCSGLAVATHHALCCLLVVLDPPLVGIVGGAVNVGVWRDVCHPVSDGAAFRRGWWHVYGCRHVDAVVVVVMV